jgi:hypothetical protein
MSAQVSAQTGGRLALSVTMASTSLPSKSKRSTSCSEPEMNSISTTAASGSLNRKHHPG